MYFRLVKANYRGREYSYLRLSESYRDGDKSRQRMIMNLANLDHLPESKMIYVMETLQELIKLGKEMNKCGLTWWKHYKTSMIMALERVFYPSQSPANTIKRVFLSENKKKERRGGTAEDYSENMLKIITHNKKPGGIIILIKQLAGVFNSNLTGVFVFDDCGFPLRYDLFDSDVVCVQNIKKHYSKDFFLLFICEKSYNSQEIRKAGDEAQIIYVQRQANAVLNTATTIEKYYLVSARKADTEIVGRGIGVISESGEHMDYVAKRMTSAIKGVSLPGVDIMNIYFTSLLYMKIIVNAFAEKRIDFPMIAEEKK
ncbi:MAG: hypothetical protein VR69_08405 [Peptococcaceae bacterium BRH_c4b]|nr:MAG: hypothetical protein VR69_08405 [Peptococcaceae bacterium BRH_c4b]